VKLIRASLSAAAAVALGTAFLGIAPRPAESVAARPVVSDQAAAIAAFYRSRGGAPLWFSPRSGAAPQQLIQLLTTASAWLDGWQHAVEGTSDTDVFTLMDLDSAVDFVLLQELARGNDAYYLSMHVWKDVSGTLHFTPWDLDLSLGQPLYGDSTLTTGWIGYRPLLIQALANDARFQARLVERWGELRQGEFSAAAIEAHIQRYLATIGDRIDENFARWPIEDIQFLDNQLPPRSSFDEEMEVVRGWIDGRLTWVDAHIGEYAAGN